MPRKPDTVSEIMQLIDRAAPGLPETLLETIARSLYADLGGERRYFPKGPTLGKAWDLRDATGKGVPFAQAVGKLGLSRSSAYRARARGGWKLRTT